MRTTANVVAHMNVEQGKRTIGLRMEREACLVGVVVDSLLDRFSLRGLSHLSLSFSCAYHYTIIIGQCQYPSRVFFPYNVVRYGTANTVPKDVMS